MEDTDEGREDGVEEQETHRVPVLARGPVAHLMAVVMDLLRDESEEGDVDAEPEDEEAEVEPLSAGREDVLPRGVLVLLGLVGSGWGSALPTEREGGGALTDGRSLGHGAELARGAGWSGVSG